MSASHEAQLPPDAARADAFRRLLDAEPMPVDDWPVVKRQMLEDRYASVMSILDTYD